MKLKRILGWLGAKNPEQSVHPTFAVENDSARQNPDMTPAVIGLDFGTAFTKVVIGVAGQKYGVPLNDSGHGTDKYLLPTPPDLKMRILDDDLDETTRQRILDHLATVLRKSREWLTREKKAVLADYLPGWEVNIGLPTEKHSNEKLRNEYCGLVANAWRRSVDANNTERTLNPGKIGAFPEFVAQIGEYINSPQCAYGLHAIIDVGAGTVDATIFIVHADMEKRETEFPLMKAEVWPMGVTYLAKHRCSVLGTPDGYLHVPHEDFPPRTECATELGVSLAALEKADLNFQKKLIKDQIYPLLEYTKTTMAPGEPVWKLYTREDRRNQIERPTIPLMLCGGGARVDFYYESVIAALTHENQGYPLRKINTHALENLDAPGLLLQDSDRLSVAYGLSFDALNIGKIVRPARMRDAEYPETQKLSTCPKCKGRRGGYYSCQQCGGTGILNPFEND